MYKITYLKSWQYTVSYNSSKGDFALTGKGQWVQWKFSAPKDVAKAFAGVPPVDRNDSTKLWTSILNFGRWNFETETSECGYNSPIGIHMIRWKLVQWTIIPGLAELLVAIALRTNFKIVSRFGRGNSVQYKPRELAAMRDPSYRTFWRTVMANNLLNC